MRIWAFPSSYPYDFPGLKMASIFAHRQYKGLVENGATIAVIQPVYWHPASIFCKLHNDWGKSAELNYPIERVFDGITVYHPRIDNRKPSRLFKKTYRQRYIESITRFFKDHKIVLESGTDIFYSQWLPDAEMVQEAAHSLGIRSAILMIGDDVLIWPQSSPERFKLFQTVMHQADRRFAVAKYIGNEANKILEENLPFDTIRRGVNYEFFRPVTDTEKQALKKELNFPAGKSIILVVGSAIVRKGWLDLFAALNEIKKSNNNFIIACAHSGPEEFKLENEAEKYGLLENFLNLGEVDPGQVNRYYQASDLFCLPSHWEGIANSVVEAMASGLPVITTNVCGHPELIEQGMTGIMVPPKRPDLLAKELAALITNPEKMASLGKNARAFIVSEWGSFADNAAKLYKMLEETLYH